MDMMTDRPPYCELCYTTLKGRDCPRCGWSAPAVTPDTPWTFNIDENGQVVAKVHLNTVTTWPLYDSIPKQPANGALHSYGVVNTTASASPSTVPTIVTPPTPKVYVRRSGQWEEANCNLYWDAQANCWTLTPPIGEHVDFLASYNVQPNSTAQYSMRFANMTAQDIIAEVAAAYNLQDDKTPLIHSYEEAYWNADSSALRAFYDSFDNDDEQEDDDEGTKSAR